MISPRRPAVTTTSSHSNCGSALTGSALPMASSTSFMSCMSSLSAKHCSCVHQDRLRRVSDAVHVLLIRHALLWCVLHDRLEESLMFSMSSVSSKAASFMLLTFSCHALLWCILHEQLDHVSLMFSMSMPVLSAFAKGSLLRMIWSWYPALF